MGFERAVICNLSTANSEERSIPVLFNPTEYSISRRVNYAEVQIPGLQTPLLQFVRGESETLTVELFLDDSDSRGAQIPLPIPQGLPLGTAPATESEVEKHLSNLRKFVTIASELHAPPVAQFTWGNTTFRGVITELQEKFVLFRDDGNILRARITVTFKSYVPPDVQAREANNNSPDRTKTHITTEGDRLERIAGVEYGDPKMWPVIAKANNLTRPRILPAGTVLIIPSL